MRRRAGTSVWASPCRGAPLRRRPAALPLPPAGDIYLHLSEHLGDARPGTLVYFYVDDVDSIAAEFGVEVVDQPWAREIQLTDPDGNRLRIGTVHAGD